MGCPDYRDLFAALNRSGARYLVIGGQAMSFYDKPRYTKDLDVWVDSAPENAAKVFEALADFGAPSHVFAVEDLEKPNTVIQIGVEPVRVDILTGLQGMDFSSAWERRVEKTYDGERAVVISLDDLLATKKLAGRKRDLADAEDIEKLLNR